MKYRHACHAGNFADVAKHVALTATLLRLTWKERPLFVLDTHAGRGHYHIAGSAEAAHGIGRLANLPGARARRCVARYLELVEDANGGPQASPARYPGSPAIAAALTRAQDRLAFCEVAAVEADALRQAFRHDPRVGVHHRDGFEALAALLPPPQRRGLALIDPPYEEQERDFTRVSEALVAAARRWPQGVLMAWYPIKQGAVAGRLHRQLLRAGLAGILVAELCVHPDDSRAGLNGSGIVAINPPWRLEEDLRAALPFLHAALAGDGAGRVRVERLATP